MAKASSKKSTKKVKRHYPVQRVIRLGDVTNAVSGAKMLQAASVASRANRRLYRQSNVYSLKIDVDVGSALATAGIDVYTLRDTWDLHGAYKQAMEHYYNAMKEEIGNSGAAENRWHDFRILPSPLAIDELCGTIHALGTPPAMAPDRLLDGDVAASQIVDAGGTSRYFSLGLTTTATHYSIMKEWQNRDRTQEQHSNQPTDMPYAGLVEDLDEANYDIIKEKGNDPPYNDQTELGPFRYAGRLEQVTPDGVMKLSTGFIDAPLGIVLLVSSGFTAGAEVLEHPLTLTFQAGDYKGVKARPYATPVLTESMEYEVV